MTLLRMRDKRKELLHSVHNFQLVSTWPDKVKDLPKITNKL